MALDADTLLDRRRLARRLSAWRAIAILVVVAAAGAAVYVFGDLGPKHVARLPIQGAIVAERPLLELVERLGEDDDVAGVLVAINSPGGTSVGGERLYDALRALAAEKPVVAHINTIGASAGYMTALAADQIFAQRTSLTGSIGVLIQYGQINELLDELGIEVAKVDSGPLKAEPNPFTPVDPQAVEMLQSVVDDSFSYFLGLVEERRGLSREAALEVADGRIFTGGQALSADLIDDLGDEDAAIAWMETERGVEADLPVRSYEPREGGDLSVTAAVTDRVMERLFAAFGITLPPVPPQGSVDGLWSVWHASMRSDARVVDDD